MKKMKVIFLLLSFVLFPSELITLDDVISTMLKQGDVKTLNNIEKKKSEISIRDYELDKFLGLTYNLEDIYSISYDNNGNSKNNINLSIAYKDLSLNYKTQNNDYGLQVLSTYIQYNKYLNDFIYSESRYDGRLVKFKDNIIDLDNKINYANEIDTVINLYIKIKNLEEEINYRNQVIAIKKEILDIDKGQYASGEGTKYNLEAKKLEIYLLENDLRQLENELKNIKQQLENQINKTVKECVFKEIEFPNFSIVVTPTFELQKKEIENKIAEENVKLQKREERNKLIFEGQYEFSTKTWTVGISTTGSFINYEGEKRKAKEDVKKGDEEYKILLDKYGIEKEANEFNYKYTEQKFKILDEQLAISSKRFNRVDELDISGYMNRLEYLEEREKYLKSYLEAKKSQNEFYGLQWKNKYIRDLEDLN
jgi:hypothetical protein